MHQRFMILFENLQTLTLKPVYIFPHISRKLLSEHLIYINVSEYRRNARKE